ncbi:hypothetical protein DIPPA_20018 [Diplonema papillatum]|nr:hypothetical protein DIPPA_20018 [Diplonema papillatum]
MSEPINLDEIDDLSESDEGPKRDVRQRTTAGPIDLDEIDDFDALQPKRKKPRKDDRKKGTPQAPQDDMHLRKIERRRKKILGERSRAPGRLDRESRREQKEKLEFSLTALPLWVQGPRKSKEIER